jgi:DNA gyrase, A subunit
MAETIRDTNVVEQHNEDMLLYSIYVARKRVIPDFRDGLKCVHRRILYAAYKDLRAVSHGSKVKTARLTGMVIGLYHPHGDQAVADAVKPMTNPFECKVPYINGQGGWGDPLGNPQSAQRYTELWISEYGLDCIISDLKESPNAVDWENNYSDNAIEPVYLPASVPNILINGAYGIATGLTVDVPRHNFNEVIDITIELMKNPKTKVVLIPDNCMPTDIIEVTKFDEICRTGKGKYKVRAKIDIVEYNKNPALHITSVPDLVFFDKVQEDIEKLVATKKLPQVVDIINESSGESWDYNMSIYIILRKGSDPNYVRSLLYSTTPLTKTRSVNFEVLQGDRPVLISYKDYLLSFIDFRRMTKFRMYCNRLRDSRTKFHKMELYIKALESGEIDNIYKMVRKLKGTDDKEYIEYLIKALKVTDVQAKYLLDIDFRKISKGYLDKYKADRDAAYKDSERYMKMVDDPKAIDKEIIEELLAAKKKYGRPRMSRVISADEAVDIPAGTFKIVITRDNRIKKMEPEANITGLSGGTPRCVIMADNRDNMLIFGALGKVFKLPVSIIPFDFLDIRLVLKNLTSDISSIIMESALKKFAENKNNFIYTLSKNGYIKRMDCVDFINIPVSGIIYSKLDDGDIIVDVLFMPVSMDFLVYSGGKALRLNGQEAPYQRRASKGNYSMNTRYPMNGIECIYPGATTLVAVTANGFMNSIPLSVFKTGKRMQAGSSVIKLGKGDEIVLITVCKDTDIINTYFNSNSNQVLVSDIPIGSSISKGTKMGGKVGRAEIVRS